MGEISTRLNNILDNYGCKFDWEKDNIDLKKYIREKIIHKSLGKAKCVFIGLGKQTYIELREWVGLSDDWSKDPYEYKETKSVKLNYEPRYIYCPHCGNKVDVIINNIL